LIEAVSLGVAESRYDTKSVEYRLVMRRGKRQEAKGKGE
jgi:hypothetical protein